MTPIPPHDRWPPVRQGPDPAHARGALVMVHGRGADPESILDLGRVLPIEDWHCVAPRANGNTWYPYSFLAPLEHNEPGISSGFSVLQTIVDDLEASGLPRSRIVLLGFSQGACLATTFAARHPGRWGGIVTLSGGLIGPPGTRWDFSGTLEGTPAFLGCSDVDPHIPKERVLETEAELTRMGAQVTMRLYPGMGHTVNPDEITQVTTLIHSVPRRP